MKLKICGMKLNIEEVADLSPDYLGFIFYEGSPRFFNSEIPQIERNIKKTGVFVNASLSEVILKVKEHQLQAVQLHGEEPPLFCEALRQKFGKKELEVLKVFSVDESFSLELLQSYESRVDLFLFDTFGKSRGGTGKSFDWSLLLEYDSPTPFFLSGGIGPGEAEGIVQFREKLHARGKAHLLYGIDVNSKFESEPGRKNVSALEEFRSKLRKLLQENKK